MRVLLLLLGVVVATASPAQDSVRRYAAISLLGDGFTIVTHQAETGSHVDRNVRQFVELADPALDNATLDAVDRAMRAARPEAKVILLGTRNPALYAAQKRSLDEDSGLPAIVARVREAALGAGATHLILVTKLRHDTMLMLGNTHVGSGTLEGLGFYLDFVTGTRRGDNGEVSRGFLAPYAYFRVALVDLASGAVAGERDVVGSTLRSTARGETLNPWDAMTAEQKVGALRTLIRREIARVLPEVLNAS